MYKHILQENQKFEAKWVVHPSTYDLVLAWNAHFYFLKIHLEIFLDF